MIIHLFLFSFSALLGSSTDVSNTSRNSHGEFSDKFRHIFRQPLKKKSEKLSESMPSTQTLSTTPTSIADISSNLTNNDAEHQICLVSDSPHYIVRVRYINFEFLI